MNSILLHNSFSISVPLWERCSKIGCRRSPFVCSCLVHYGDNWERDVDSMKSRIDKTTATRTDTVCHKTVWMWSVTCIDFLMLRTGCADSHVSISHFIAEKKHRLLLFCCLWCALGYETGWGWNQGHARGQEQDILLSVHFSRDHLLSCDPPSIWRLHHDNWSVSLTTKRTPPLRKHKTRWKTLCEVRCEFCFHSSSPLSRVSSILLVVFLTADTCDTSYTSPVILSGVGESLGCSGRDLKVLNGLCRLLPWCASMFWLQSHLRESHWHTHLDGPSNWNDLRSRLNFHDLKKKKKNLPML